MKKFLATILVLAMALSLMACGSSGAAATEEPAEEAEAAEEAAEEPAEEAADEAAPASATERIIILNTAVLELEASDQPRGDEMRPAYSFADLIESVNCEGNDPCQTIGSDGYTADEPYDDLLKKYITLEGESAPILVGEAQDPDWATWEVAYVRVGTDTFMTSYTEEIPFTKVFEDIGMVEADAYDFICSDGYTATIPADEIGECSLKQIEGRADGIVPGVGDDSLWDLLYVQPAE